MSSVITLQRGFATRNHLQPKRRSDHGIYRIGTREPTVVVQFSLLAHSQNCLLR